MCNTRRSGSDGAEQRLPRGAIPGPDADRGQVASHSLLWAPPLILSYVNRTLCPLRTPGQPRNLLKSTAQIAPPPLRRFSNPNPPLLLFLSLSLSLFPHHHTISYNRRRSARKSKQNHNRFELKKHNQSTKARIVWESIDEVRIRLPRGFLNCSGIPY
ncbi:hypothetical protein J5N97_017688 [Dioscorea zingiberensis]|uniref:Uncharacterized protein n=1 Tax=Dioscorea zingiberensis TaxID=325984 RepID=A0A9D5HGT6_9LILI|nr:hypothetical protein J5N97_017688 [Dioscorea zingiberensis]